MDADTPFDRQLRRTRRDRAATRSGAADYLFQMAVDELLDRLGSVKREFSDVLDLGCAGGILTNRLKEAGYSVTSADSGFAFAGGGVQCDEDRLPFGTASFDLIMSIGVLDTVNDLPGALALARRALRPDGLFLAAFVGAGSLPRLRAAMLAADAVTGAAAPRIHPQIDVRAAGDLLGRAGFALPVADFQSVSVRFPNIARLIDDLRSMAATNILAARSRRPILRTGLGAATTAFAAQAEPDGKVSESFEIIYLAGWSPSPSQPQPAPRGSASHSLASALKPSKGG
jgi:NADH dehydrogenase [ubiquinone] 1 alpha subcomplex assembly factor 5